MNQARIPFLNMHRLIAPQRDELLAAAAQVLDQGIFVLGAKVEEFEDAFARRCGTAHAIGVGNGLDALRLMLRAAMITGRLIPGDEVILPAHTFIATALAVSDCSLVPVFADVSPETGLVGVGQLERCRTSRTRGVLAVHLYGQLCDMLDIDKWCRQHHIHLFEDAAQAHGARLDGCGAGQFGLATAFSFFPTKNLGALGDGGAVVTDDPSLAGIVTRLRNYGSDQKYYYREKGFNTRLDELQAAFLLVRLRQFDAALSERRRLAIQYLEGITNPLVQPLAWRPAKPDSHAWHLFVVRTPERDRLQGWLDQHGIDTQIHYPVPVHLQDSYRSDAPPRLPETEALCREILSLPLYPGLERSNQERVISACNSFAGTASR